MSDLPALTRRRFLRVSGAGAAATLAGLKPADVAAESSAEAPLFRFVQFNDTHVDASDPADYRLANEKFAHLVDWINTAADFPRPDFALGIGDLINGEKLESLSEDFARFQALAAGLKCPLYPVVGNHEVVQREGDPVYEAPYRKAFGEDRVNYTFRHGNLRFVMLNNSGAPNVNRTEVGRRRNRWLRDVLQETPRLPKILCCHIPLFPLRDEQTLRQSFGFSSYTAGDDELLSLIDAHADSLIAVLSGHLHLSGAVRRNGVYHIVTSGTASYPCDFATYEVFAGRIRVRMRRLPQRLCTRDTNIHGRPRFTVDYTDAAHPDHESYLGGNPSERDFEISLAGKAL